MTDDGLSAIERELFAQGRKVTVRGREHTIHDAFRGERGLLIRAYDPQGRLWSFEGCEALHRTAGAAADVLESGGAWTFSGEPDA